MKGKNNSSKNQHWAYLIIAGLVILVAVVVVVLNQRTTVVVDEQGNISLWSKRIRIR